MTSLNYLVITKSLRRTLHMNFGFTKSHCNPIQLNKIYISLHTVNLIQIKGESKIRKKLDSGTVVTTDSECVCESLLLTDQTPDSGNPLLICCHGVVLSRKFNKDAKHKHRTVKEKRQKKSQSISQYSHCQYILYVFHCAAVSQGLLAVRCVSNTVVICN